MSDGYISVILAALAGTGRQLLILRLVAISIYMLLLGSYYLSLVEKPTVINGFDRDLTGNPGTVMLPFHKNGHIQLLTVIHGHNSRSNHSHL